LESALLFASNAAMSTPRKGELGLHVGVGHREHLLHERVEPLSVRLTNGVVPAIDRDRLAAFALGGPLSSLRIGWCCHGVEATVVRRSPGSQCNPMECLGLRFAPLVRPVEQEERQRISFHPLEGLLVAPRAELVLLAGDQELPTVSSTGLRVPGSANRVPSAGQRCRDGAERTSCSDALCPADSIISAIARMARLLLRRRPMRAFTPFLLLSFTLVACAGEVAVAGGSDDVGGGVTGSGSGAGGADGGRREGGSTGTGRGSGVGSGTGSGCSGQIALVCECGSQVCLDGAWVCEGACVVEAGVVEGGYDGANGPGNPCAGNQPVCDFCGERYPAECDIDGWICNIDHGCNGVDAGGPVGDAGPCAVNIGDAGCYNGTTQECLDGGWFCVAP
jgi:hypothetical protein